MSISVAPAQTHEERERVYAFRYRVYVEEMGLKPPGADHERRLLADDPGPALLDLKRGFEQTGGRRWLIAPGCSISPQTPRATLRALRDAVETAMVSDRSP